MGDEPSMTCMFLSCPFEAVSSVFVDTDHQPSPLSVCWTHERDLVDRYGYEDVQPRPLHPATGGYPSGYYSVSAPTFTAAEALAFLRGAS